jgi:anthranilate phosphoribosyltransferase
MDARTAWPAVIGALIKGDALTAEETAWAMNEIMEGAATAAQIAGFGVALRIKGETVGEVTGLAQAMLEHGQYLHHGHDRRRRGRGADGQARQPGRLVRLRDGRRA